MHIKQVIVHGFKSYKDTANLENLSPEVNVVVGANGSGKSNFFHAIRFVIDSFDEKKGERKGGKESLQALLHHGTGHPVQQAWVELVFHDEERRLGGNSDTVHLRRTITVKDDKFSLDRKHLGKQEVQSVLEAAGFSRSNPYNIVQQGKISQMSQLTDTERLNLLKEIGGASLYEDKRKESERTMMNQKEQAAEIDETLASIDERITKLEEERQELLAYHELDRKRRAIEYCILEQDALQASETLQQVAEERAIIEERAAQGKHGEDDLAEKLQEMQQDVQNKGGEIKKSEKAFKELHNAIDELMQQKAALEIDVADMRKKADTSHTDLEYLTTEVKKLEDDVEKQVQALAECRTAKEQFQEKDQQLQKERDLIDSEREALFQQQNRQSKFKTQADRDEFLKEEIVRSQKTVADLQERQESAAAALQAAEQACGTAEEATQRMQAEKRSIEEKCRSATAAFAEINQTHNNLMDERKALWQKETDAAQQVKEAERKVEQAKGAFRKSMAFEIFSALDKLTRIVKERNIAGFWGPLIKLIDCEDKFNKPVERTAGNRLFHVVVDNADVATKCISILNEEKLGRLTFLPLTTLNPTVVDTQNDPSLKPICSVIKHDQRIRKAVQTVWGKVVIAKDSTVASKASRQLEAECVTMAGDKFTSKGTVDGGFVDSKRLRLNLHADLVKIEAKVAELERERVGAQEELKEVDKKIKASGDALFKADKEKKVSRGNEADMNQQLQQLKEQERANEQLRLKQSNQCQDIEARLKKATGRVEQLSAELAQPMAGGITDEDTRKLTVLQEKKETVMRKLAENRGEMRRQDDVVHEHQTRLVQLQSSLAERKADLEERQQGADPALLQEAEGQLKHATEELESKKKQAANKTKALQELRSSLEEARESHDQLAADLGRRGKTREEDKSTLKGLELRDQQVRETKQDIERRMRDLGALGDVVDEYVGKDQNTLQKALRKVTKQVEKTGASVNRKALEEFQAFISQRASLSKRRKELAAAEEAITRLMEVLENRKDAILQRTFTDVASAFHSVFQELVPGGKGDLIMINTSDGSKYEGVKVSVAFGKHEPMTMRQLSGGQKTLVSLALIFAIQRTDPAPFYLLDEVDAALDPQYRKTVADLLSRQATPKDSTQEDVDGRSAGAQFIITTFHPQIVEVCSRAYGVEHSSKVSIIKDISPQAALTFVQNDKSHREEGKGEDVERRASKRQKENMPQAV